MANWADLDHGALTEIAWRIKLHEDFVVFREVCISWRSVAVIENFTNKCNQIPWLMLPSKRKSNLCELLSISKGTTRQVMLRQAQLQPLKCLSSKGWLLTVNRYLVMNLLHPFSGRSIELPLKNTIKDWKSDEVIRRNLQLHFISKFLLLSCYSSTLDSDYTVIILYGQRRKLAYFRSGIDKGWNTTDTRALYVFHDVISYQKQIYAITTCGMIMVCDIKGDNPTVVHQVAQLPWEVYFRINYEDLDGLRKGLMLAYLVESDGALWVITRHYKDDEDDWFQVFEVDLSTNKWEEIYDLGDKALFLGYNSSLCIKVSDTSYCKPNSIYFTYDNPDVPWNGSQKNDMGVYSFEDGSISVIPFYRVRENDLSRHKTAPIWVEQSYNL